MPGPVLVTPAAIPAFLLVLAGVILLQRVVELRLAAGNRRRALANGAREYGAGHYPLFLLLHGGWLAGWIAEGLWRRQPVGSAALFWLGVFVLAQCLRFAAIRELGDKWNTRILVVPGSRPVTSGIYRYLKHPNYLAVTLELAVVPLAVGAWTTAVLAGAANAALLLLVRIPAETRALAAAAHGFRD